MIHKIIHSTLRNDGRMTKLKSQYGRRLKSPLSLVVFSEGRFTELSQVKTDFALVNRFGSFSFKNVQKLHKFQVECNHPGEVHKHEGETVLTICERCSLILSERTGDQIVTFNEWFNDKTKKLKTIPLTPRIYPEIESWENEGGFVGS